MPPASRKEKVTAIVRDYVAIAELKSPYEVSLRVHDVARACRVSRTSLWTYELTGEIEAARARQLKRAGKTPKRREKDAYAEIAAGLREALERAHEHIDELLAQRALIEGNAQRLGIDPHDLYRPLLKPDRRVSRAGTSGTSRRKSF